MQNIGLKIFYPAVKWWYQREFMRIFITNNCFLKKHHNNSNKLLFKTLNPSTTNVCMSSTHLNAF